MRIFPLSALAVLIAGPALAGCPAGTTPILTCTFEHGAKRVDACQDGTTATYAFGKAGQAPDLTLVTPVADLDYTPWPGVGRSIWEEVSFYNQDITYLLWFNYDKVNAIEEAQAAGAPDPLTAGISVLRGDGEGLASLECDPGSIDTEMDALSDAKERLGLCWDGETWGPCE